MATFLQVALEGLTGGHGPLGAAPFHLNYRLRVVIEGNACPAGEGRTPTTMDVVSQVFDRGGPPTSRLVNSGEFRHPGFGLRQLRRARSARIRLTVACEWLRLCLTHSDLLKKVSA